MIETEKGTVYTGGGDGYGYGGACWIWVILLFALFGWGNGFGNRGYGMGLESALTRSDLQQGFDNQTIQNKIDNLSGQLNTVNNGLCDGFYETTKNLMQGQNQLQRDLCSGFSATNSAIAENRYAMQNCCCETKQAIAQVNYDTNRNIDALRYEGARNTCDIVNAIERDGEKTRGLMIQNTIQALRDKVTEKDQELQTANFQLSQQAQTANIISTLQPISKPAYLTCSPYQSAMYASNMYGFNGCGCGCGCVCC